MPVMDGMSATRAIRQYEQAYNVSRCCIIALTGLASNSARLEAWNSGIDHYMTKPVNFKKLAEILSKERTRRASIADSTPTQEAQRLEEVKEEVQHLEGTKQEAQNLEEVKDGLTTAPHEKANDPEVTQLAEGTESVEVS